MKKLALTVAVLTACGGKSESKVDSIPAEVAEKITEENQGVDPVESTGNLYLTKSDLPTCDESRKSHLAYVDDELKFYGCDGKEWNFLPVQDTSQVKTTEYIACFIDHTQSDAVAYGFNYVFTEFSNGTAAVSLQAYLADMEQASQTLLHGAGSLGAQKGYVNILSGASHLNELTMNDERTILYHTQRDVFSGEEKIYETEIDSDACQKLTF